MIATGGLLRINARRQDSLRSKPHKPNPQKKKRKNKRSSEVVVVKGKLNMCSFSGLVAVLGILVLLVGGFMAALGYWPRDGLFFSTQPQEGAAMAIVSSSIATPKSPHVQEETWEEKPDVDKRNKGDNGDDDGDREFSVSNQTETINGTTPQLPQGFLEYFLDRYLYSDRLKVFGPLIMGIGIFFFICANAVLHENRDKKTKVINLRDIYSTVIDVHSIRKPHPPSDGSTHVPSANPLNGLVNYVQSQSLDSKPWTGPTSLLLSRQPANSEGGSDEGVGTVFSICQHKPDALSQSSCRHSLPQSCSPCWSSQHKEALTSFTIPRSRQHLPGPRRRHSFWAGSSREDEDEEQRKEVRPPPLCTSPTPNRGSKALLLQSSSSLSSLSCLLSSSPAPPCRRQSLPTASINFTFSKLSHKEEQSLEWSSPQEVASQRRGSSREKLKMMSQRREEESSTASCDPKSV